MSFEYAKKTSERFSGEPDSLALSKIIVILSTFCVRRGSSSSIALMEKNGFIASRLSLWWLKSSAPPTL